MRPRWGAFVRLTAWLATLGSAIVAFTWLGQGSVGTPTAAEPSAWVTWSRSAPPEHVVFALGRLLVLGLAWYLVGVTLLGLVARMARSLRLVRLADAVTVPGVRRMLQAAMGLSLATAAVAPTTAALVTPAYAAAAPHASPAADAVTQLPPADPPSSDPTPPPSDPTGLPVATSPDPLWHLRIGADGGVPTPDDGSVTPAEVVHPPEVAPPAAPAAGEDAWEVRAGDHLWGIAEHVVSRHLGRPASDREIAGYWRRLIADNRTALADPGDPDLIHPGQRFTLPPLVGP